MAQVLKVYFASVVLQLSLCAALSAQSANATSATATDPRPGSPVSHSSQTPTYEDWSTIVLAKSGLPLQSVGAVMLGKTDLEGCTRERLRMQWRVNDPIDIFLVRPRGTQKMPPVLFVYNYSFNEAVFQKTHWCDVATHNGFAVVGLSSALSWPRMRSPRPMKEWFVSELPEALATSTHDVQMILNYLETRNDIDTRQVGIFGEGSGGAIAVLAAAADPRIRTLDLLNPWGDWPDWLKASQQIPEPERPDYLKPEFLAQVSALDPIDYLPRLKDRAIHMQQVLADPVTPAAARDRIAAAMPQSDSVVRYDTIADAAKALGNNGIVAWIAGQLQTAEAPASNP